MKVCTTVAHFGTSHTVWRYLTSPPGLGHPSAWCARLHSQDFTSMATLHAGHGTGPLPSCSHTPSPLASASTSTLLRHHLKAIC